MDKAELELDALLKNLESYCYDHGYSMFVTVKTGRKENNGFITRITSPNKMKDVDNKITELVLIMRGFVPVSEDRPLELEYDTIDLEEVPIE